MNYRLSGIRKLNDIIDHLDVIDKPGVYILYDTKSGPPKYVGRADTKLYKRMLQHKYEFKYYKHKPCKNDKEAYYWECVYFHKYEKAIENVVHPAHLPGTRLCCPICKKPTYISDYY
jgi:hypothetical protein